MVSQETQEPTRNWGNRGTKTSRKTTNTSSLGQQLCGTVSKSLLTLFSSPSMTSMPLWLRYNSRKFTKLCSPSILVRRLFCKSSRLFSTTPNKPKPMGLTGGNRFSKEWLGRGNSLLGPTVMSWTQLFDLCTPDAWGSSMGVPVSRKNQTLTFPSKVAAWKFSAWCLYKQQACAWTAFILVLIKGKDREEVTAPEFHSTLL